MRVLVVGAGALGGYFGGRLLEAGRDVAFLVRPARAEQIARHGLRVESRHGNAHLRPRTVLADGGDPGGPYDLILLAVKAPALEGAMDDLAPALGAETAILPVLNGMRHLNRLVERFGPGRVLGGVAQIPAALGPEGRVRHLGQAHQLAFGEVAGGASERVRAMAALCEGAKFEARASEAIVQEMWEKWVMLATLAGMTCLMRASVGDIIAAPGGQEALLALLAECRAVAGAAGHVPRPAAVEAAAAMLTAEGSPLTASMLRDIEGGGPTEGEHVLGDMADRAERMGVATPVLRLARCHVAAYEARRTRERAGT
jgi:2-dehydropantoate 2-reductase